MTTMAMPTTRTQTWGTCDCGAWGAAPAVFDPRRHILLCGRCDLRMYLHHSVTITPADAGFAAQDRVTPTMTAARLSR